ncbi:7330_t:CDS:1 [Diversispora eburnea]|uniref:7330_t:CDS:1 n=1 Tax=Diversispora eburnea TaxID=1213867 RepID=A0A9N8YLW2_9GLOM|nr:7330_t:CDS:1 [Diversispora eburnea]
MRTILPKVNFFHTTLPSNKYKTNPSPPCSHTTKNEIASEKPVSTAAQLVSDNQQQPSTANNRIFIAFTCKVCLKRSTKTMSRKAYYFGVVIVQCSQCQNRHLIADHMGWFRDNRITIEDIMLEQGEKVIKFVDASRSEVLEWNPDILEEEKKLKDSKKANKRQSNNEE